MVVSVQFFGTQRALTKTNTLKIPLAKNGRVIDVFQYLMDCYPNFSLKEEDVLVTVNNNATNMDHTLNADDKIVFLPHVGGG